MRFNSPTSGASRTLNHEGDVAYTLSPALDLYSAVTASPSDEFYDSGDDRLTRMRSLVGRCDPAFVAKLVVYAREQMYLRSIPLALAVELAKVHNGDGLVAKMSGRVTRRADETAELLAYYQQANARGVTKKLNRPGKQLRKGLSAALNTSNEYGFAKYRRGPCCGRGNRT